MITTSCVAQNEVEALKSVFEKPNEPSRYRWGYNLISFERRSIVECGRILEDEKFLPLLSAASGRGGRPLNPRNPSGPCYNAPLAGAFIKRHRGMVGFINSHRGMVDLYPRNARCSKWKKSGARSAESFLAARII